MSKLWIINVVCNDSEMQTFPAWCPNSESSTSAPTHSVTDAPSNAPSPLMECCFDLKYLTCKSGWCGESENNCSECGDLVEWMKPVSSCLALFTDCTFDTNSVYDTRSKHCKSE